MSENPMLDSKCAALKIEISSAMASYVGKTMTTAALGAGNAALTAFLASRGALSSKVEFTVEKDPDDPKDYVVTWALLP